ncbi:flavodoxin [Clostridium transplantifaecale]|uniref:flavodoxin n=1 Tax=Clostridium transplantifaecale TaxID=2479838 RepID=UPI000F634B48|nr:flavodoxin [Clostridium transplantifaecale]
MKSIRTILLLLAMSVSLTACGKESVPNNESPPPGMSSTKPEQKTIPSENSNILIAYFSVPEDVDTTGADAVAGASVVVSEGEKLGNTQYVAQLIQQTTGGDLFRIETTQVYPGDHDPLVEQAAKEQDADARPELATQIDNFDQYEIVLLGYPNWWGDMPQPLYTFLEEYDFGAKTMIPFITHGGSGASRTVETISELQPGALIRDNALILSRNDVAASAGEVTDWAEGLHLNRKNEEKRR